ncbi:recombinase family protein [Nocardia spumae]|uniref:recombinase family protein n=1 Tax=Nocardia spumae TaxID=2887190 RepID=UPI001D14FBA0|nr:recombinase family protein [Nocardia spumae]
MIRCGVYLRQSDDADDDELAVSRQWDEVVKFVCEPRGWEPVRYCDNDRTAVGDKRKLPDRDRMLRDVEAGRLQAIASWDLDRLYREPIDLEHIIGVADRYRTMLATVSGDVDLSTDNGRLFARIKGAVAKAETERRSARQKAKYRQLAEAGKNYSSRRPFGRHHDGTLHEVEAPALAEAYELILSGHTLHSICADWNRRGIKTTLGNEWRSPTQLSTVMKNPRNAGWKSYRRQILDEVEVGWDRIVSPDVWRAVNEVLSDPSRRPVDVARKHQLTGIALCGECALEDRHTTVKAAKTSSSKAQLIYRCRKCFRVTHLMSEVDDLIDALVIGRLSQPDAAELLIDQRHPDLDVKRSEAAALRERMKSAALMHADGDMTDEQFRVSTRRTKEKLAAIEQAIEDANRSRLFKGAVGLGAVKFPELHLDRRRAIIDSLMTITLLRRSLREPFDPNSVVVEWKGWPSD